MTASPRPVPRWLSMRVAALIVGCWREGVPFSEARLDGPDAALALPGLDGSRRDALARVEALAYVAEARSRTVPLPRLGQLVPERWAALEQRSGRGADEWIAEALIVINGPKVWAAMGAMARALNARAPLPYDECMEMVGRILEA